MDKSHEQILKEIVTMDHHHIVDNNYKFNDDMWITHVLDDYCKNYYWLILNHKKFCACIKTTRKQILLVNFIPTPENSNIDEPAANMIHLMMERLTKEGYVVRLNTDLIPCSKCCKNAIVSEDMFHKIKEKSDLIMWDKWSDICSDCQSEPSVDMMVSNDYDHSNTDIIPCSKCNKKFIVSREMFDKYAKNEARVSDWTGLCRDCT